MRRWAKGLLLLWASLATIASSAAVSAPATPPAAAPSGALQDEVAQSSGSVMVGERRLVYQAATGVLVVQLTDPADANPAAADDTRPPPPAASMSYVAYFLGQQPDARRPITFLFNGGPGSATIWLHMGAFGPKRVLTADERHGPAAPYTLVDNPATLLGDSDLVFIDAPGTGFGRLRGADKEKAFYGVDPDAHAFANFIVEFLSRHGRWNSPKYLFGESYGTLRAAVVTRILQSEKGVDVNGVMLLSQILAYDDDGDAPQLNPGVDQIYALALPTYAATAWYQRRLPERPAALEPFLAEVESFALNDYLTALAAGNTLAPARRAAIVAKLHAYTGLPADYIERADLRINVGMFSQQALGVASNSGRLDTRFSGPALDPLAKESSYDPLSGAINSPYVSVFNDYVRRELHYGDGQSYKWGSEFTSWDFLHQPPGAKEKVYHAANVMPDLATAMTENPHLKVQMHGGYYDLATPYFAAIYELNHLPVPAAIAANIEICLYPSGHMIYTHAPSLAALSANAAAFIRRTATPPAVR